MIVLEPFQKLPDEELEVVVRQLVLLPGANDLMQVGLHERLGDVDIVAVLPHILHAHPSDGLFVADAIEESRESAVAAGGYTHCDVDNVLVLHVAKQLDLTQSPAPTALSIVCIHPYNQPRDIYRLKTYTSRWWSLHVKRLRDRRAHSRER
jgi:hypothetical protein